MLFRSLKYGQMFEEQMMSLSVNIPLEEALDLGWKIMAGCFDPEETGVKTEMITKFWPKQSIEKKIESSTDNKSEKDIEPESKEK